jgi:hypothetical protein
MIMFEAPIYTPQTTKFKGSSITVGNWLIVENTYNSKNVCTISVRFGIQPINT